MLIYKIILSQHVYFLSEFKNFFKDFTQKTQGLNILFKAKIILNFNIRIILELLKYKIL